MIAAISLALSKFGAWVAKSPAVQWALGALGFVIGLILWGERREGQGRKQERVKQREENLRQKERAVEYVETLKEELQDEAEQAIERRDDARPLDPDSMSDDQRKRIFGRGAATRGGSKRR